MRVSDTLLSDNFINSINAAKSKVEKLQTQIATNKTIQDPSDSPATTVRILNLSGQLSQSQSFSDNIKNSLSLTNETTSALETIQSQIVKVMVNISDIQNPTNNQNLNSYADQIDLILNSLLNVANSEYDGKYLFGGTDFSASPYGLTSDNKNVEVKVSDVSGRQKVKISSNIYQKINMTGTEIFGTVVKQNGNLDSTAAIGAVSTTSTNIYDAEGTQYTFQTTYTKTAANTYNLTYDILDGASVSVFATPPAAKEVVFNSSSGNIQTIAGTEPQPFTINVPSKKINFSFDPVGITEKSAAASLNYSANQKTDIFNTLISIRDNLRLGIKPTTDQDSAVKNFNNHLLDKISELGNISNQLKDSDELLGNQQNTLNDLISKAQEVDTGRAIIDLQNQDYILQLSYKLSSMILPKSLLDFL